MSYAQAEAIYQGQQTESAKQVLREYRRDGGMSLNLHEGQLEAWYSTARFIGIISGTQGGKTSFLPHWLLREIGLRGNGDYLYVAPTFTLLDKKALPEFLEVFETRGNLGSFKGQGMKFIFSEAGMRYIHGERNYNPDRPTTVYFGHAGNPESLESATAKAAVLDEAGQKGFKLDSWFAIQRRLSLHKGRALIATTPYNRGWLYTHFYKFWQSGDPDYHVISFASTMNPAFPLEELERARRTLPKWKFEMFYLGKFSRPAGLIYEDFSETNNVIEPFPIPNNYLRVAGFDFGDLNTAGIFLALPPYYFSLKSDDPNRKMFLYREYYPKKKLMIKSHVRDIWRKENPRSKYQAFGGASSESQWRREFKYHGLPIKKPSISSVEVGIDRVYEAVKLGQLKIFKDCPLVIEQFMTYSREVDETTGEPIEGTIENKSIFHLLDAARYGISAIKDPKRRWTDEDFAKLNPDAFLSQQIESLEPYSKDIYTPDSEYRRWVEEREGRFNPEDEDVY